jgi:hypothetical protein
MDYVGIGDAGNTTNDTGNGAVTSVDDIGKYEVTRPAQY